MSAPKFVPVGPVGAFRDAQGLPVPDAWMADRPGEIARHAPTGKQMGRPGPDQGYALKLASSYHGKLGMYLAAGFERLREAERHVVVRKAL